MFEYLKRYSFLFILVMIKMTKIKVIIKEQNILIEQDTLVRQYIEIKQPYFL